MTGKRAAARARVEADIMRAARAQLAEVGAASLSLREVAREVGMVSSAVYRYVESRDHLLTQLIIESYDALGEATERTCAELADAGDLDRWVGAGRAIRSWAIGHPHDYLLLYGSPVPGYAAPDDTIAPGTRVTFALVGIVSDAHAGGRLTTVAPPRYEVPDALDAELADIGAHVVGDLPNDVVLAFIAAWTQLFGLVSFELSGQTRNVITEHEALFAAAVRRLGHQMGLR